MALRILLADDSMTAQNMGKKILTDAGFDVVTVSNGAAAVKKLAEAAPDIAILDVYMPGYTGLEVCERMKASPATGRVPVLLSVGKMEPFRPEDGMKVRADGVIIKPFEATDLVTVIKKLADRSNGAAAVPEPSEEQEEAAETPEGTAVGLQTFAPVEEEAAEIAAEPGVEFTSQAAVAVASAPAEDFVPTVLQEEPDLAEVPDVPAPDMESAMEAAQAQVSSYGVTGAAAAVAPAPVLDEAANEFEEASDQVALVPEEEPVAEELAGDPEEELCADDLGSMEEALASAAAMTPETGEMTASPSEEIVSIPDEPVSTAAAFTVEEEDAAPFVVQEEEVAEPFAVQDIQEEETVAPVDWTAVEADIAEDGNLDLEAEMEQVSSVEEIAGETATEQVQPPVETAVPLVAPLGRTSYDELESLIEQTAAEQTVEVGQEESAPVLTEEPVEQDSVLSVNEVEGLMLADELPGEPAVELLPEDEVPAESVVMPAVEDVASEPIVDVVDSPLTEVPQDVPQESGELLEVPEEQPLPSSEVEAATATGDASQQAVSALAFYGLDGLDDDAPPINNPIESPDDEPLFAVMDDVTMPSGQAVEAPADEVLVSEEVPTESEELVLDEPASEEDVLNSGSQLDEVAPMQEVTAEPTLGNEDAILAEMPAAEPSVIEEPLLSPEPEFIPQAVASEAAPAYASANVNEEVVTAMVGRVVDRVVDRLKPILTVMVEEILAEVKKK